MPIHKVNIDAGFTCPNRDGTVAVGGCIYCNNVSFKPGACRPTLTVREQVRNGKEYVIKRYGAKKLLAYFQPYTNTHAPVEQLEKLYREAVEDPLVMGLAIGTRPDCIDSEKLDLLKRISSTHFVLVEYGVQSIYDRTLRYINRGHDYETFLNAVRLTRERGIHTGAHIIVGFPTENTDDMLAMAYELSDTGIGFLKIHQLQVVKDTALAGIFRDRPFHVFGYEEYLDFIVDFIERLSPEIVLQRLFATAPDDILIAPTWGRSRYEIIRDIDRKFLEKDAWQGKKQRTFIKVR